MQLSYVHQYVRPNKYYGNETVFERMPASIGSPWRFAARLMLASIANLLMRRKTKKRFFCLVNNNANFKIKYILNQDCYI